MTEHTVPMQAARYDDVDTWQTPVVLTMDSGRGYRNRYGLGLVGRKGECRRVTGGPVLPGPYAYAYGLATAITANPVHSTATEMMMRRALDLVIDVEPGDVLVMYALSQSGAELDADVYRFRVGVSRFGGEPELTFVETV